MQLDVRIPLGLLLLVLGAILVVYGIGFAPTIQGPHATAGNMNLHWGIVFMACGGAILGTVKLGRRRKTPPADDASHRR